MSREHREWTDRFSDYLAGDLDDATRAELEVHVAGCGPCRLVLEEIRAVVSEARGLGEVEPVRDLWPGIAAAIRGPLETKTGAESARVIELPTARALEASIDSAKIAFTPPQLAAAAIVLIALSAMTTWWAGPGLGVRPQEVVAAPSSDAVTMVADLPEPSEGLSTELEALEAVLQAARQSLDPNTVRVLERNLSVIEAAIEDSRQALALDPENEFLSQHLERSLERKLTYLRDAARVIEWAG